MSVDLIELPVELLLRVATFLTEHDLLYGLSHTCRLLYAIATDAQVWASIPVTPCCKEELRHLVVRHPSIRCIDLVGKHGIKAAYEDFAGLPQLQSVTFAVVFSVMEWPMDHGMPLTKADFPNQALGAAATLRELTIVSGTSSEEVAAMASLCTAVTNLTLNVTMDEAMGSGFPSVVTVTPSTALEGAWELFAEAHPNLTSLSRPHFLPHDAPVFSKLRYLSTWATTPYITRLVAGAPHLEKLQVDEVTVDMEQAMMNLDDLTELSLNVRADVHSNDFAFSSKTWNLKHYSGPPTSLLDNCTRLHWLSGSVVCDAVVMRLGSQLRQLRSLVVDENLTAIGAAVLAEEVTSLRELAITCSPSAEVDAFLAQLCCAVRSLYVRSGCVEVCKAAAASGELLVVSFNITDGDTHSLEAFAQNWVSGCRLHGLELYQEGAPADVRARAAELIRGIEWVDHVSRSLFGSDIECGCCVRNVRSSGD